MTGVAPAIFNKSQRNIRVLYQCPFYIIVSNRRYNIKRHTYRKHPEKEIPKILPSLSKPARYSCPYCKTTSNRKYNMKEHIKRKHIGAEIPNNLLATEKNFMNSSSLSEITPIIYPSWLKFPKYIQNSSSTLSINSTRENFNNYFFKIFLEILTYRNFIRNQSKFQNSNYFYSTNILNPHLIDTYYEDPPNPGFGKPFLFKIYKCSFCFNDFLYVCNDFDKIKTSNEFKCCFNTNIIPRINKENKDITDPIVKEVSIYEIFSIIDNKLNPKPKLCLKSIKIPKDFHRHLYVDLNQFIYNETNTQKPRGIFPQWLQRLWIMEKSIELENIVENDWANRLMTSNKDIIEITREELIRIINLSNATFGLFNFQKDHNNTSLFFAYLQLEKEHS